MSALHLTHIQKHVSALFGTLIDTSDLNTIDKEYSFKVLARSLAAYSVHILSGAKPEDIAPFVIDGSDDNGIDCVFYDSQEKIMYFSQSKWIKDGSGEPELGDIKKFTDGIRDLVNLKFDRFNPKLNRHRLLISQVMDDPSTKYNAVIVYTGIQDLSIHGQRTIEDLLTEMNDASELLKVTVQNQTFLHHSLTEAVSREPINVDIGLKYWGKVDSPQKAFYGQLNASSVADWWASHAGNLFDKNLRSLLGDTDVNEEIRETLEKAPENFWFFNNGITILADKVTKTMTGGGDTDFGTFHCTNISVVNGAQTVSTIGKYATHDLERVKKANVHCRVIELGSIPSTLSEQITKTNNRQNRIENRDFVSLDPEQLRIKNDLAIEGYSYILQRNESLVKTETIFDLTDSTTALACISQNPSLFVQLKREIGKLWEDISKAPYKQLFNPSVSSVYILRAVTIQRRIDQSIDKLLKSGKLPGNQIGVLIHGNRMISARLFRDLPHTRFSDPIFSIDTFLTTDFETSILAHLGKITKEIEANYPNAVIPTFFKNLSKCTKIYGLI